jgi:short subunit dehydrogenase-like uncharacterized protein
MPRSTEFDMVVYGASGFTGRLVAEYLAERYGVGGELAWAMAGRDLVKLNDVREAIGAPAKTPLLLADADDPASLAALAGRTRIVITTVGPYQLYGEPLVAACAAAGVDYLDLCGEPAWMRRMIDRYDGKARETGARILFSCGFDSIPFELGVWFLEETAMARLGRPVPRVMGRVCKLQGGFSGGTAASLRATLAAAAKDPEVLALLQDPFALTPGFKGPPQPSGSAPVYDEALGAWAAPFAMAAINTRNIHRSNALQAHAYGADLVYDEMISTGPGAQGEAMARAIAAAPSPLAGEGVPKPGEGPGKAEREGGFYDLLFVGVAEDGRQVRISVSGDRDPGYGSTSRMIAETAVCLLRAGDRIRGGVWTPGAALGRPLVNRLAMNAGLTFKVESA